MYNKKHMLSFLGITFLVDLKVDRRMIEMRDSKDFWRILRMPIGGGGILIPGGKPRATGAI